MIRVAIEIFFKWLIYMNLSLIQDQAQLSSSNRLEMAKIKKWLLKSNHFETSVFAI